LITAAGLSLALSSCACSGQAAPGSASARYVGKSPDRCPYLSANQVARVIGRDVTRVKVYREPDGHGAKGCLFKLPVLPTDPLSLQYVVFTYLPRAGLAGCCSSGDAPMTVISGLGIRAVWAVNGLTVLTRQNGVVEIALFTDNTGLSQAEQIYRLAAPHLSESRLE
jgi:hypothetical protein